MVYQALKNAEVLDYCMIFVCILCAVCLLNFFKGSIIVSINKELINY